MIVTSRYDNIDGVRKKVFVVRGEEPYARTTDIVLNHTSLINDGVDGIKTTLSVDVYRLVGKSSIILYDGEDEIGTYSISATDGNRDTLSLGTHHFTYYTEHNLTARLLRNDKCSGSRSKSTTIQGDAPSTIIPVIENNTPTSYVSGEYLDLDLTVLVGGSAISGAEVSLYIDNEYIDKYTTGTNGKIQQEVEYDIDDGLHNIQLDVTPTNEYLMSSTSFDIGVGSRVEVNVDLPIYVGVNGVRVKVADYFGNPVTDKITLTNRNDSTQALTPTVDDDEVLFTTLDKLDDGEYSLKHDDVLLQRINLAFKDDMVVTISTNDPIISDSQDATVQGTVTSNNVGIPDATVDITTSGGAVAKTITAITNENGVFTASLGKLGGYGDVKCTATVNNHSDSTIISSYLMYWSKDLSLDWNKIIFTSVGGIESGTENNQYYFKNIYDSSPIGIEFNKRINKDGVIDIIFTKRPSKTLTLYSSDKKAMPLTVNSDNLVITVKNGVCHVNTGAEDKELGNFKLVEFSLSANDSMYIKEFKMWRNKS